jgi:hypothetical protein
MRKTQKHSFQNIIIVLHYVLGPFLQSAVGEVTHCELASLHSEVCPVGTKAGAVAVTVEDAFEVEGLCSGDGVLLLALAPSSSLSPVVRSNCTDTFRPQLLPVTRRPPNQHNIRKLHRAFRYSATTFQPLLMNPFAFSYGRPHFEHLVAAAALRFVQPGSGHLQASEGDSGV